MTISRWFLCRFHFWGFANRGGMAQVDFPITDVLQMMGRAGRPQFDTEARAVVMVHEILGGKRWLVMRVV